MLNTNSMPAVLACLLTINSIEMAAFATYSTFAKSMRIALEDLKLARLFVVYPGEQSYELHRRVEVIAIQDLPGKLALLV